MEMCKLRDNISLSLIICLRLIICFLNIVRAMRYGIADVLMVLFKGKRKDNSKRDLFNFEFQHPCKLQYQKNLVAI